MDNLSDTSSPHSPAAMINQAKNLTLRSPTHAARAQIISLRPGIFSALAEPRARRPLSDN
jgi:hypothetical protein